jgi:hypothetical protein
MKTREDNKLEFYMFNNVLFEHMLKKLAHSLLVHGHSLWSTFGSHLVKDPKAL